MRFPVPQEWASSAILECADAVFTHKPEPGRREVFEHGSGLWEKPGTSYYFNSGCNITENTPCGPGDVGTLSRDHMKGLEDWFLDRFKDHKPKILTDESNAKKRNFTLIRDTSVLNFHMEIE